MYDCPCPVDSVEQVKNCHVRKCANIRESSKIAVMHRFAFE
jgi:hypothetical protein